MYTKYEVNGADSFGEKVQKPRKCTDGRTQGRAGHNYVQGIVVTLMHSVTLKSRVMKVKVITAKLMDHMCNQS